MSLQNSPVARGISSDGIAFDTLTSHSWKDPTAWPAVDNSEWIVEPDAGQVIVLLGVLIKFTHGMDIPADSKMTLEGIFDDGVDPYLITEYDSVEALYRRGDQESFLNLNDPGGGPFRKPIVELKYEFSQHIFLWSSAGLTGDPPPNHLYVDKLGIPKFKKLRVKIADNVPYKYYSDGEGDSTLEIACSRYFAAIYADPGN